MIHELKTHPEPFDDIIYGRKTYEIRKADRDFKVGDFLFLREWKPLGGVGPSGYTGREIVAHVMHMTKGGQWGLPEDVCLLGIRRRYPT